jgi:hypothetical protein
VPTKGIRMAKKIKGTSIKALFERVSIEILPASEEITTRAKKAIKAGQ